MSDVAIKVESVSKLYHIGLKDSGNLRDSLAKVLRTFFSKKEKKSDNEFWALKNVSFEVKHGDVVGIIGRNGAGKSTLLKVLSRITEPSSGRIEINGRVASLLEVGTGFHPELTGRENIFMNGSILGMKQAEVRKKFDEIVDFSGIEKFIDTPVKHYSSGMYVRLAFAVAAHLEPEILIIDEVLAVGDAEFQKKCLGKMQDVSTKEGRTVLFVSHQLGMIRSICEKGFVLSKGNIVYSGTSNEAVDYYLQSNVNNSDNCIVFPNLPKKEAQILNAKIVDKDGIPCQNFDVFDDIYLEIEYIVRKDLVGSGIFMDIERNGVVLFRSFDTDMSKEIFNKREKGFYKSKVKLFHPLKAGVYQFNTLGIGLQMIGSLHEVKEILRFNIEERSYEPTNMSYALRRPGEIVTQLQWNTEKLNKNV